MESLDRQFVYDAVKSFRFHVVMEFSYAFVQFVARLAFMRAVAMTAWSKFATRDHHQPPVYVTYGLITTTMNRWRAPIQTTV